MANEGEGVIFCEKCGGFYGIGAFPFCRGDVADHGPWAQSQESTKEYDEENLTDQPGAVHFSDIHEKVRFMDANSIVEHKPKDEFLKRTSRGPTGKLLFMDMGAKR